MVSVPAGPRTRDGVCFGVLGVSPNVLEPDVAFLVQPLHTHGCMGDTGHLVGEGCTATGALL